MLASHKPQVHIKKNRRHNDKDQYLIISYVMAGVFPHHGYVVRSGLFN